jgi:hypothetical protein
VEAAEADLAGATVKVAEGSADSAEAVRVAGARTSEKIRSREQWSREQECR